MAYVDLDKIINVTGGGSGTIYPDVPYPVLNQRIGIFNTPDARDTDSNGWFGLLGNSNAGICQQNYNFNQQIALAVDSGVGALSTRIKSYDFSVDIDKIDGGAIKWGLMKQGTSFFDINSVSKKIKDVYISDQTISLSGSTQKGFIVTSGGNRFLLIGGNIYSIDTDNIIQSSTPTGTYLGQVLAIVGNYVWTISIESIGVTDNGLLGRIYTIDSLGASSLIDTQTIYTQNYAPGYPTVYNKEHCQGDNTIAYVAFQLLAHFGGGGYLGKSGAINVDLTNTGTFTWSDIYHETDTGLIPFGTMAPICGYDTGVLIVSGTNILRITPAGVSASLGTYIGTVDDIAAKGNSVSLLTTLSSNISTLSTALNILGITVGGDSITTIYDNVSFLYEPTGTLSQDDSFVGILTNLTTIGETDPLIVSINSTTVETIENMLYNYGYNKTISLPQTTIGTPNIEIQLEYANTLGNDLKLGIGITGGTYATPTLPANNGMSGNATTERTAGINASYIDLTLST